MKTDNSNEPSNASKPMLGDVALIKTDFMLIGLSRKKSMTCTPMNNEEIFWPKVGLTQDRFDALWNYFKGNKPMRMIAEIEHKGFHKDGTPIDGIVVGVRDL